MLDESMSSTLPDRFPCRKSQIQQLTSLFSPLLPLPPIAVVYGLEFTGRTAIVRGVLQEASIPHAFISSKECITGRHLLEQTVSACIDAVEASSDQTVSRAQYNRCENLSALAVHLQQLLEHIPRMVLVLDGVDKQREAPPTLLPALSRLGEIIPSLSIIFIVNVPRPRFLHKTGVLHLHFPSYTKDEIVKILAKSPPDVEVEADVEITEEDVKWLWTQYVTVLWDSLGKGAAKDLGSFKVLAQKLWKPFIAPVLDGTYNPRDFSRIMVSRRALFQNEDVLIDSIIPKPAEAQIKTVTKVTHALPYYSKFLLCAAYLASFNPARSDAIHFMKSDERRRKRKGGRATAGRAAKHRKISRHLLSPSLFPLDRLLAILHSITPHSIPQTADIYTQIATLSSLRLLLRSGAAGGDVLDPACKWRVNFGLDYVTALGRTVGFELSDHLASVE